MPRAYRSQRRSTRAVETRERLVSAVRELLAEGKFHESTVDMVADRAGVARATLYQHFRSRLDLIDAICDTFDANPALVAIRDAVELSDPDAALAETIAHVVAFWSSEEPILNQLYGVAAVDPAARDLVERQRADRRGEMQRLVMHLRASGRLRPELAEQQALAALMMLTSYETFRELRVFGLTQPKLIGFLQTNATALLVA